MKKFCNLGVTIRRIPSHLEVKGNEEANRQAEQAAKGNADSPLHRLPTEFCEGLPDSKSTIKQEMTGRLKQDAVCVLRDLPQWRKLQHIDPTMLSKHYQKMADSLL
jgi:hypothetical protein